LSASLPWSDDALTSGKHRTSERRISAEGTADGVWKIPIPGQFAAGEREQKTKDANQMLDKSFFHLDLQDLQAATF
jgi:hypothetical protein